MAPSLGKVWVLACTSTAPVGLPAMRQEDTLVTQEVSPTPCTQGRCAPNRAGGMRDGTQGRCAPDKTGGTDIDPRHHLGGGGAPTPGRLNQTTTTFNQLPWRR